MFGIKIVRQNCKGLVETSELVGLVKDSSTIDCNVALTLLFSSLAFLLSFSFNEAGSYFLAKRVKYWIFFG